VGVLNIEGEGGLLDTISWSQFQSWLDYYRVDPFGNERGDMQAALIASAVANVERTSVRSRENPIDRATMRDYLMEFGKEEGGKNTKDSGPVQSKGPSPKPGRRILTADAWAKVVAQTKDTMDIATATHKTRDRGTGEVKYENRG
jgi:hypothetical protein